MGEPFHVQGVSAPFHPFTHSIGLHQSLRHFYGASLTICSYAVSFLRPTTADLADGPDIPSVNSPTKKGWDQKSDPTNSSKREETEKGVECDCDFIHVSDVSCLFRLVSN